MMTMASQQQDIIQFSNNKKPSYPIATKFISQFATWAKFWLSINHDKTTIHKRRIEPNTTTTLSWLYRITCYKLQPNTKKKALGDVLHIRKFWQDLEAHIYQEHNIKRVPFDPDLPGSVYLPKKSRKRIKTIKREPYASTYIVYTFKKDHIETKSLNEEDDDNVPLGILRFK